MPPGHSATLSDHALLNWYSPPNAAKRKDLDPTLTVEEGGEDAIPVLELAVRPATGESAVDPADWTGIVQEIDRYGVDMSGLQAVELWVNDFRSSHTSTVGKIRLALGRFSEDAFWDPRNPPNYQLDTEDKNGNGILDRPLDSSGKPLAPGQPGGYEDTGLDGTIDADEPGYNPDSNKDPDGDDYAYNANQSPNDYSRIDNLEGNGISPDSRPDTEDLNRNGVLDEVEASHEVAIDLADTAFVAIDVPRDYPGQNAGANNGWRLFRVPFDAFHAVGPANWDSVQTIRLVLEQMPESLRLQIAGIRFVGVIAPPTGRSLVLHQNRPNPFNPGTAIEYELRLDQPVHLEIFDVAGRRIATLVDGPQVAGPHRAFWSGRNDRGDLVPSGVYFYRLRIPGHEETRRMVLLK